jgi:hypothetical protein
MRKPPLFLIPLLLSLILLIAAASAHALELPLGSGRLTPLATPGEETGDGEGEGEGEGEGGSDEGEEDEGCSVEEAEEEPCVEEGGGEAAEECLLEAADASVVATPGNDRVRLTVRYRAFEPTAVNVDAGLRGSKGSLHLGSERARFHRAGVYRDSFSLGPKQMPKALAAREFEIRLRAVGSPADCRLDLATRGSRRAR